MKLINDFFRITEVSMTDGGMTCRVALNPDHYIYSVHFPGNPVTPGVCLLQMAAELLEHQYESLCPAGSSALPGNEEQMAKPVGRHLKLDTAVNIRFKNPVLPNDDIVFDFSKIAFEADELKVRLTVKNDEQQFITMSLKYKAI